MVTAAAARAVLISTGGALHIVLGPELGVRLAAEGTRYEGVAINILSTVPAQALLLLMG